MPRPLPPLNAARAFEAAARHLSFIKAAEELHVTPGAISQQVRALEEWVGRSLFRRLPKGVRLTDAGQELWPKITDAFDMIAEATTKTRNGSNTNLLTISAMPSVAARWLIPRLGRFTAAQPGIEVKIEATVKLSDFSSEDVDVAIRFGGGRYQGLFCELLMEELIFPVCSPAFLAQHGPFRTLDDLRATTLIHTHPDAPRHYLSWGWWFEEAGGSGIDIHRGPQFPLTHMSIAAAIGHQGVALASSMLIGDDLATGRLVRPMPHAVAPEDKYWLVCPEGREDEPAIAAFRAWAKDEASRPS
jgi:LysR family transcriptional regulator, glycine cleavage system transcriptional activator